VLHNRHSAAGTHKPLRKKSKSNLKAKCNVKLFFPFTTGEGNTQLTIQDPENEFLFSSFAENRGAQDEVGDEA
jgi:hypothetical protein